MIFAAIKIMNKKVGFCYKSDFRRKYQAIKRVGGRSGCCQILTLLVKVFNNPSKILTHVEGYLHGFEERCIIDDLGFNTVPALLQPHNGGV